MKYLIPLLFLLPVSALAQEVRSINVNKFCAAALAIPYGSDNITDEEWNKFQECLKILKEYEVD